LAFQTSRLPGKINFAITNKSFSFQKNIKFCREGGKIGRLLLEVDFNGLVKKLVLENI
jgi:hypothetical protein